MRTPFPVHACADVRAEAATVLASLPLSFAPARTVAEGVAVVGGGHGWPGTVARALDAGAVAVIVVSPGPADVTALLGRDALIVLDSPWAANPVVASASVELTRALPRGARLECRAYLPVGSDPESALLDQLALVRALVGPAGGVGLLTLTPHGYAAEGTVAGHPLDVSLVCTDAVPAGAWARLLTNDGCVELSIPSGVTAQPARLSVTSPDGLLLAPTHYESGHRATWRRVWSLLADGSLVADLEDFVTDRTTARTAFQLVEG